MAARRFAPLLATLALLTHPCESRVPSREDMSPPAEPVSVADSGLQAARQHTAASLTSCFKHAYTSLVTSSGTRCAHMDEDNKRRLALGLARCHLQSGGRPSPPDCDMAAPLLSCVTHLATEAFHTYTLYTTHVDNLCYYLDSHLWREETSDIIQRLITGANDTAHVLAALLRVSSDLRSAHARVVVDTQAMHTSLLSNLTAAQHEAAQRHEKLMQGVKEAEERAKIIAQVISRVAEYSSTLLYLQGYIVTNLIMFQSLGYYVVLCVSLWLLTASPQTSAARFPCTVALLLTGCTECLLVWAVTNGALSTLAFTPVRAVEAWPREYAALWDVSFSQWALRALHALISMTVVVRTYCTYVDHAARSHALLLELRRDLLTAPVDAARRTDASPAPQCEPSPSVEHGKLQLTLYAPSPALPSNGPSSAITAHSIAGFPATVMATHPPAADDVGDPAEARDDDADVPITPAVTVVVAADAAAPPARTRRRRGSAAQ